jgi:hypothetical protein
MKEMRGGVIESMVMRMGKRWKESDWSVVEIIR